VSLVVTLSIVRGLGWVVTSIERTAYPRFKRLTTAHELHLFFSPSRDEREYSTHELGVHPEAYAPKLDVDFIPLREQELTATSLGQAA
jgi:hypothetical protein